MFSKYLIPTQPNKLDMFKSIIGEILQGDYGKVSRLMEMCSSLPFKQALSQDFLLTKDLFKQCHQEAKGCNSSHARMLLGFFYQQGIGCTQSNAMAIHYYEESIQLNNGFAMNERACMHRHGQGGLVNFAKAIELFEQAIALGNTNAMNNRAFMHQQGLGGLVDLVKAIEFYERAIALGNVGAMNNRGLMHRHGEGGPVNFAKAIEFFERAIALGSVSAIYSRANMHQYGQGGHVDYNKAIELYEQAIELGNMNAMNNRALMHLHAQGGPVDYDKAIELYEQAINLGDASAMYSCAFMHQHGQSGLVDYDKAIALYEQAIKLGYESAMYNRASMHQEGQGDGGIDLVKAVWLYERAYRHGMEEAQKELATILITKDMVQALLDLMWEELVAGKTVTEHTLKAFFAHGKEIVLEKINNSELATSLTFLKQLKITPTHPITKIINSKQGFESAKGPVNMVFSDTQLKQDDSKEFNALIGQAPCLYEIRAMFFSIKPAKQDAKTCPLSTLPVDLRASILSLAQPGLKRDVVDKKYESSHAYSMYIVR